MTAAADQPNWRDDPDALNRLCEQGARDLYGDTAQPRDVTTIEPDPEYL